jgi:hypothetical protein
MNRREALSRAALLLGGAISAPVVSAVMAGCKADSRSAATTTYLTPAQEALLNELCDIILPVTSTPSATAVGVPAFIHAVMQDCTPKEERDAFVAGLAALDVSLSKLSEADKLSFLKALDAEARAAGEKASPAQASWRKLKELAVVGYFTSEIGASEVLEYVPVPGQYNPCMPMPEGQRAYAV